MTTDSFDRDDPLHGPLLYLFFASVGLIWFYGISRWKNLIESMHGIYAQCKTICSPGQSDACEFQPGKEPHVTVQMCAYNEGTVVLETIERVCSLDWPVDKLHIQICDDSTEKESIVIIEDAVAQWREKGMDITRLERPDRIGYKAGNLHRNFKFIEGDFVAYLDADHQAESDFLKKTIPHFFDEDGISKDHVALVQAPWCYYNTHQNLLTECGEYCTFAVPIVAVDTFLFSHRVACTLIVVHQQMLSDLIFIT
jgi:cellulose synthase/poly-beta-1,6-N-acetylglucosamine synthase-like glycosyltransferase